MDVVDVVDVIDLEGTIDNMINTEKWSKIQRADEYIETRN